MDFDTVHRENLGHYSSNPFDENPYIPQTDDHPGFSSVSHRVHLNNLMVEGSSWNPSSNDFLDSSFNDPFDPFQACFGKLNQDYITGYCKPFAQEYAAIRFVDNIVNADHSRTPFLTMDHEYDQMNEGFDYSDEKNNSPNGKYLDKGSCVIVDGDDGNRKRNGAKQNAKRKRIIDNKTEIIKGQWTPEEDGLLVELVEKHGVRKWSSIAQMLPGRIGKQCRERWHNHLKPNIKVGSDDDDEVTEKGTKLYISNLIMVFPTWRRVPNSSSPSSSGILYGDECEAAINEKINCCGIQHFLCVPLLVCILRLRGQHNSQGSLRNQVIKKESMQKN
ncbi:hypothetical protein OROGR_006805 [Orobanche gracilis]